MALVGIVDMLFRAAIFVIMAGVVLSMIRAAIGVRWMRHPIVDGVVQLSEALCTPFRGLMEAVGIPTRPLDFSPMVAIIALQLIERLILSILL
jgi:YggT family protein